MPSDGYADAVRRYLEFASNLVYFSQVFVIVTIFSLLVQPRQTIRSLVKLLKGEYNDN